MKLSRETASNTGNGGWDETLLAEDTIDLNRAVSAILSHEKYEVDSVYDGLEALEHIKATAMTE